MAAAEQVLRYSAFTDTRAGGNPAGVVLDARDMADARMLELAAEIGYSEPAFLTPRPSGREYDVRYFSAEAEVPFCGHATIATAVALAERDGTGDLVFHIAAGPVAIHTGRDEAGAIVASLTSVAPAVFEVAPADVEAALALLGWSPAELDAALPPRIGYAGARHLILAAASRGGLADLDYDYDGPKGPPPRDGALAGARQQAAHRPGEQDIRAHGVQAHATADLLAARRRPAPEPAV